MKLTLQGFRRFTDQTFQLDQSTLFVGPNGVGKTTVLEALQYLSVGKSHRTSRERELIGWTAEAAHVSVELGSDLRVERSLAVSGNTLQKRAKRNGVPVPLLHSIGLFQVVLFAPEQLDILTGPPRLRRRYLDILLSSTEPLYAQQLAEYAQALRQRNQLLTTQPASSSAFDSWESILAQRGRQIIARRDSVVSFLSELLPGFYAALAADDASLSLAYQSTISDPDRYEELLAARRSTDQRLKATSTGPHRDDVAVLVDDRSASEALSRGEQRSALLALKRAELTFFTQQRSHHPPLLLLDDMFSELDQQRSAALAELIADQQCYVTTTDATRIPKSVAQHLALHEFSHTEQMA